MSITESGCLNHVLATSDLAAPILDKVLLCISLIGRELNSLDDVLVASTAAEIAFQSMPNLCFGWIGIPIQERARGHDHPRCAIPTLEAMHFPESHLDVAVLTVLGHSFNCCNRGAVCLNCKERATLDRLAIQMNRAGAALAGITANVSPGQPKVVSQETDKQQTWLNFSGVINTIHIHANAYSCRRGNCHVQSPSTFNHADGTASWTSPAATSVQIATVAVNSTSQSITFHVVEPRIINEASFDRERDYTAVFQACRRFSIVYSHEIMRTISSGGCHTADRSKH